MRLAVNLLGYAPPARPWQSDYARAILPPKVQAKASVASKMKKVTEAINATLRHNSAVICCLGIPIAIAQSERFMCVRIMGTSWAAAAASASTGLRSKA